MDDLEEHHAEFVCRVVGTLAFFKDDRVKGRTCAREFVAQFSARFPSPVPDCIGAPDLLELNDDGAVAIVQLGDVGVPALTDGDAGRDEHILSGIGI